MPCLIFLCFTKNMWLSWSPFLVVVVVVVVLLLLLLLLLSRCDGSRCGVLSSKTGLVLRAPRLENYPKNARNPKCGKSCDIRLVRFSLRGLTSSAQASLPIAPEAEKERSAEGKSFCGGGRGTDTGCTTDQER